jgi:general secretion pathway protein A
MAMDRVWSNPWDETERSGDPSESFQLPSRCAAVAAMRPALRSKSGPVLLTGDAGVGKTWLWRRLHDEMPPSWRWVLVDVSPASGPAEFYRLLGRRLGWDAPAEAGLARLALADFLRESEADAVSWVVAIDEAHGLSEPVLEEIRITSNRLGRPDGLAGLVLIGQTALARRLATRPLAGLSARLAAHIHLRALDFEEARALVDRLVPDLAWSDDALERAYRDARGNPRRLLRLAHAQLLDAARRRVPAPRRPAPEPKLEPARDAAAPLLGPAKPPIHVEEGFIEVGWEPDAPAPASAPARLQPPDPDQLIESDELIDDHYAALQAWNEWAQNQGRAARPDAPGTDEAEAVDFRGPSVADELDDAPPTTAHDVWAEGQQSFAPYSQLFSRMRQGRG